MYKLINKYKAYPYLGYPHRGINALQDFHMVQPYHSGIYTITVYPHLGYLYRELNAFHRGCVTAFARYYRLLYTADTGGHGEA